ncbi:hypothetical protein DFH08DRAFT_827388 [Mycena albidolilacea]|uniref:Uncharacterized protein n=1 Tax=Mycena albidolilacea TaxID=1033008 RepID=A0AAD6YY72_9AGAR|nr:hypothetical protein DFH08DRAFT_827388 [Mycena albidolilacea]
MDVPEDEQPENVLLFLPSALMPAQHRADGVKELAAMEDSVCDAQCSAALERLRRHLHMRSRLLIYKKWQSRHQGIVERNKSKIRLQSEKYQMAWAAKLRLADGDVKRVGWEMLCKENIRCMEDAEELAKGTQKRSEQAKRPEENEERAARGGESIRTVSWIWTAVATAGTEDKLEEALCMEWCKVYARVRRWDEEVKLVKEEVCRVRVTLEYRAVKWEARVRQIPVGAAEWAKWEAAVEGGGKWCIGCAEGAVAYALKQAAMYRDIAAWVTVSMMEERRRRGKKRRLVYDDEWVEGSGGLTEGGNEDEQDLDDLQGDHVADTDFILGGSADDD